MGKMYSIEEQTLTDIINVPREILSIGSEQKFPPSAFPNMISNAVNYMAESVGNSAYQSGLEEGYNNGYSTAMSEVSETINNAYQSGLAEGYNNGYGDGTSNGISIGEERQYNEFWDEYQKNGTRTDYKYAFAGGCWTVNNLKPKYDISNKVLSNTNGMFAQSEINDLASIFPSLTTSNATQMFYYNRGVRHIGEVVVRGSMNSMFDACSNLVTIDKLKIEWDNPSGAAYTYLFNACDALENIVIEGKFNGDLTLQRSTKLSKYSIVSIVNALSTTSSGKTLTLSLVAVNKAFETSTGANDGSTSAEWLALVGTRTNWTISLV